MLMWLAGLIILLILSALIAWRLLDHRADRRLMRRLLALQPLEPKPFSVEQITDLPEPARRYFLFSIKPGTPLNRVALIEMSGQFGMGNRTKPNYLPMQASQVLAAPEGFIWKMRAGRGLLSLSGSDSQHWTRFWLLGLVPVARMGGDPDHRRSAFGRYLAESLFWTPAALLPGPGIHWTQIDTDCARVSLTHQGMEQSVDIRVAADGQPTEVFFQRWSNANPEKTHRLQPFGGYLSQFDDFAGFRLPRHVEAGNQFARADYFPFFVVDISAVQFPPNPQQACQTGPGDA